MAQQPVQIAPPVLTVVHRLSGLKVLRSLRRSGTQVDELSDEFLTRRDSHTSITAGFALGDGRSVVARLQQAEVETDVMDISAGGTGAPRDAARADLMIVGRDGQEFPAKFVGLDAWTGLSLLQIDEQALAPLRDARPERLRIGQRVRLLAPEPAARTEDTASGKFYLRLGERDGKLTEVSRGPSGAVARLTVRAPNLSPAMAGGVALDDAGEMIGIVETTSANEVRIIPSAIVRGAAGRVLARCASVPRPWLGARGLSVAAASVSQLVSGGWARQAAIAMINKGLGIMLTSVLPGTPAAQSDLRAGDVIVRAGGVDVKSADNFAAMLNEAAGNLPLRLTVLRPDSDAPQSVTVRLNESSNTALAMEMAEARAAGHGQGVDPFIAQGAETIQLTSKAAAHLGARGGRLIVFVQPESAASLSGLRAGDVIESINGRLLADVDWRAPLNSNPPAPLSLGVVRDRQKLQIDLQK